MSFAVVFESQNLREKRGQDSARRPSGFTLVELLVVMGIIAILAVLAMPAFTSLFGAEGVTAASYNIVGAVEAARSYAMSHDTYTWIGFFEEDGTVSSANPAHAGVGRIVISTVASADGTMIYSSTAASPVYIDPTRLVQIAKLTRISNTHLLAYGIGTGTGSGTGSTLFATRPAVSANAQVVATSPPTGSIPYFQYPVGSSATAQYTFTSVLQFSPRGEVLASGMAGVMTPLIEVGLQAAHGNVINSNSPNSVALQVAGISGNVILYRQ